MNPKTQRVAATIRDACLGRRVRQLGRAVSGIYNEALRPVGLTISQVSILTAVACREPASPGEVAKGLRLDKSTLSRNLDRMVAAGWVTVLGGRPQTLGITRAGEQLLTQAFPLWEAAQSRVEAALGRERVFAISRKGDRLAQTG
jgi:DNA-binding MarR family transcriptional regulator